MAGFLFLPALEVIPDHVQLFVKHGPRAAASCVASQFKGFSSRMVREEFPHLKQKEGERAPCV